MPYRWENGKRVWIEDWGSHTDRMIREAQARGDFDNLPGTGKPILLEENVFAGEMEGAYRVASNANAAPLWITLDKEVSQDLDDLATMLERTARYLEERASHLSASPSPSAPSAPALTTTPQKPRWWHFSFRRTAPTGSSPRGASGGATLADLEAERQRARTLYLKRAAEVDKKIDLYNAERPRHLTWLEKQRLTPHIAARRFDARVPAFVSPTRETPRPAL
jgi:hypothetical protein